MRHTPVPYLLAALALAFFGSLFYAAAVYPTGYDWRHTVMSSLANPSENPHAYRIASTGMALGGLFLALLGLPIHRALRDYAPRWTLWGRNAFILGGVLLTVSALITPGHHPFLGLPKAHAKIAQAAGVAFGLGMALDLPALLRLPARYTWVRVGAIVLIVVPMTFYLTCRIFLPPVEPPAVHEAIHQSLLGALAFWEWVGSTSVYLFVALVTLALPPGKAPR
jgi:hypothetical protein